MKSNRDGFTVFCSGLVLAMKARASSHNPPDCICRMSDSSGCWTVTQNSVYHSLSWEKGYFYSTASLRTHLSSRLTVTHVLMCFCWHFHQTATRKSDSPGSSSPICSFTNTQYCWFNLIRPCLLLVESSRTVNETLCLQAHRSNLTL